MPRSRTTNEDRDRAITSLFLQLEQLAAVINWNAKELARLRRMVDALTLNATMDQRSERREAQHAAS
jgi:hypothetical protein